jgi:hypothetical protein
VRPADVAAGVNRIGHQVRAVAQACGPVVAGQVNGYHLVPGLP